MKIVRKLIYTLKQNPATDLESIKKNFPDIREEEFWDIYALCRSFTMTSVERMYSLYQAVGYIINNKLEGDLIECGVWKGGSAMLMATFLSNRKIYNRKLILYDTYEGMSDPTEVDKDFNGVPAAKQLESSVKNDDSMIWCYSTFENVKENLALTGFPPENVMMIKGKVEETIPSDIPSKQIALLRLDTDWYKSTYHELEHLYPLLIKNGILIIDDYGHWEGCRKAVDDYFDQSDSKPLMMRIDVTGRIVHKI